MPQGVKSLGLFGVNDSKFLQVVQMLGRAKRYMLG